MVLAGRDHDAAAQLRAVVALTSFTRREYCSSKLSFDRTSKPREPHLLLDPRGFSTKSFLMNHGLVALAGATAIVVGASASYEFYRQSGGVDFAAIPSVISNSPSRSAEQQKRPAVNRLDPNRYTEPYNPSSVERELAWLSISAIQTSLDREPVLRTDSRWLFRKDPETGYVAVCAHTIHTIFEAAQWPVTSYAAVVFDRNFKDRRVVVLGAGDQPLQEMGAFCGPMGWHRP